MRDTSSGIFEKINLFKGIKTEEIAILSILTAAASAGRVIFTPIPNVQPTSFIIIMTGILFRKRAGFIVGVLSALLSNMFLGQGPWTIGQMIMWGAMGLTAGIMGPLLKKNIVYRIIFGFVWGFIFGWGMDISMYIYTHGMNLYMLFIYSVYFDLLHAIGNVAFISLSGNNVMKIFSRIKQKYQLFE
jgi:energy-coupling factor transport system substrate-specific component